MNQSTIDTPNLKDLKYIPIQELLDLHSKSLSHSQIAKIVKCSPANITQRLQASGITSLEKYKKNRANVLALIQSKIINSISDAEIKKANLQQKMWAFGVLYDKERLETGRSTQNISSISLHQSIDSKLQEIEAMLHGSVDKSELEDVHNAENGVSP